MKPIFFCLKKKGKGFRNIYVPNVALGKWEIF